MRRPALLLGLLLGPVPACSAKVANPASPAAASPSVAAAVSASTPPSPSARAAFRPMSLPRIDVHEHIEPGALGHALALLSRHGIGHIVNLSGGTAESGELEATLAEANASGHATVFANLDWREAQRGGNYGARLVASLIAAHKLGVKGLKIEKGLGLGYRAPDGKLLAVDDKNLDAVFQTAGKLKLPIAIHTGDPKAFWRPPTVDNERYDELSVHPRWSFYGAPVSWEDLYAQFERRVQRHPRTTFIGVHFGNDPEDPVHVASMLDRHPNLIIDTAARVPELGRVDANHDAKRMRAFFEKYQDRILFGTDFAMGNEPGAMMLGSQGADPPGPADVERFFGSTWRYFETSDVQFESPTPIQGRWKIDGVGLPRDILKKIYAENAARIIGMPVPAPTELAP